MYLKIRRAELSITIEQFERVLSLFQPDGNIPSHGLTIRTMFERDLKYTEGKKARRMVELETKFNSQNMVFRSSVKQKSQIVTLNCMDVLGFIIYLYLN